MKYSLLLAMYCLLGCLLSSCSKTPAEDIILANIEAMETAIEHKAPNDALALIHENFHTDKGYDKKWVTRTLMFHSLRHQQIELLITNVQLNTKDEVTILANFHVLATGGKGLLPDQGAVYNVDMEWRLQDGDWLLVFAKWHKSLAR